MRHLIVAVAVAVLVTQAHADTMARCNKAWENMSASARARTNYQAFARMCLRSDYTVATATSPVAAPAGATAQCKDGTYTTSKTHAGACSQHGGVAKWL